MGKDFYKILGVPKDATEDQIRKAYRKLSLKHHPDKNPNDPEGAKKRFCDITEAFEVLSDKRKRQVYDQVGEEGLKGGMGGQGGPSGGAGFSGGGMDPEMAQKIFAQFFGGGGGGPGGFSFNFGGPGGADMDVDDDDEKGHAHGPGGGGFGGFGFPGGGGFGGLGGLGGMMGGMGGQRGAPKRKAARREPEQAPPHTFPLPVSLKDLYLGTTKKMSIKRKILDENTHRQVEADKVVEIEVKPGWKEGTKVRFERMGDEEPGRVPSDVVFVIKEKPDPRFQRSGNDLIYNATVPLRDALLGTRIEIETLDERKLSIPMDIVRPGDKKVIRGEGMPISKQPGAKGDLIVQFNVEFPRSLSEQQKRLIREARL